MRLVCFLIMCLGLLTPGYAQRIPSHCLAFAEKPDVLPIRLASTALARDELRIAYLDHSMFQIDSHGRVRIVTDYNGSVGGPLDVVTMNHAHSSHYTDYLPRDIKHVLRGWDPAGGKAEHRLELEDVLIRNVTTDIRSGITGREPDGNSIFIFEAAGLCVGHLGHLHHIPTDEQFAQIGRLDIVMAPVDGGQTLALPEMITTLKRLRALVVLPMHWWGRGSLNQFLSGMSDEFAIERLGTKEIIISQATLPRNPTVMVIEPRFIRELFDE